MNNSFIDKAVIFCEQNKHRLTLPRLNVLKIIHSSAKPIKAYDILKKLSITIRNPHPPTAYRAIEFWKTLPSDENAKYDKEININAEDITPQITWGTSPQDVVPINGKVPNPSSVEDINRKKSIERSLEYMGLEPDQEINKIKIDKVFIGSCTNGRIEDLREVARVVKGKKVSVDSMIVPGSGLVKEQAESEGLDKIFIEAGFDWREPGCSMCLAMNPDQLKPRERCASTSNRNFEGRQGREGRTHLVSPVVAAASAIKGSFAQETDL